MKKRFLLRVDPAIYDALEKWAADDLRSVNAQIEFLLQQALRKAGRPIRKPSRPGAGSENEQAGEASEEE